MIRPTCLRYVFSFLTSLRTGRRTAYYCAAAGVLIFVVSGYLEGRWTGRWHASADLKASVARLDDVPRQIGDWDSTDSELDPESREATGAEGFLLRQYMDQRGTRFTILLVCGRPGPVSVHTPDICYQGIGAIVGDPDNRTIELRDAREDAEFKVIRVRGADNQQAQGRLEVYWSWNAHGRWENPKNPRFAFARYSYLYKLYVIRNMEQNELAEDNPATEFLQKLLPALDKALFPQT